MKKIALLLCLAAFLTSAAHAQDYKKVRFGFQASPTWSWLRSSDRKIEGVGSNWGIKLGMMGEFYFAPNYAFTTGLGFGFNHGGFLQNGYSRWQPWSHSDLVPDEIPSDIFATDTKIHYRINYVEIPVGLKMKGGSNEDSRMKFYAEVPVFTIGFVSKATGDIRGSDTDSLSREVDITDINIRDEVKGLSLSWGLGGGIEYEFATNATLVAGLSFQKQFTDVSKSEFVDTNLVDELSKKDPKTSFGLITFKLGVFF